MRTCSTKTHRTRIWTTFGCYGTEAADRAAATGRYLLLVIDGLNEDRHLHGLPSVASLLPQNLSEYTNVLLTSRPNLKLPRDVPRDHPIRAARLSLLRPFRGAPGKIARLRGKLLAAVVVIVVVYPCSADVAAGGTVAVIGDIMLVRQYNNQPAIIFTLATGGIGYFTRPDSRWWETWAASYIDPHEPVIEQSTIFASGYGGFEVLGNEGGTLTFAWRSNYLQNFRWNEPVIITVHGKSLTGIRGRPGFLEYPAVVPGKPLPIRQFLALVPQSTGGVGLYERVEPGPTDWGSYRWGLIARQLGRIDFVTATVTGDGGIMAILRIGTRLYEVSHPPGSLPQDFGTGWSAPTEIRTAGNSRVSADGDPELINAVEPPQTQLELAVPVDGGLELLTPLSGTDGRWRIDRIPVPGGVDSVSVLGGSVGNRTNIDVVYRSGSYLFSTWKWDGGKWSTPMIVTWGAPP